ncbi:GNAT family N-acetyltransferase [Ruminococcaceae bacterium OttesenSCG-928-A16]|nr:GNAT family N-acetyltransferase [Ruminococcaceae bacterium OttesenSCG-928-A16]
MRHKGTQPIETERLILRRFTLEDAQEMFENWANDPEVTRYMRWQPHKRAEESAEVLATWVQSYQSDETYQWAIVRKSDGVLMGSIGMMLGTEEDCPAGWEPGYCIGAAFWGHGYTTEALNAVVDYFLNTTGETTLWCCHATANPASGRVMEKAGFVYHHDGVYHKPSGEAIPAKYYCLQKRT